MAPTSPLPSPRIIAWPLIFEVTIETDPGRVAIDETVGAVALRLVKAAGKPVAWQPDLTGVPPSFGLSSQAWPRATLSSPRRPKFRASRSTRDQLAEGLTSDNIASRVYARAGNRAAIVSGSAASRVVIRRAPIVARRVA